MQILKPIGLVIATLAVLVLVLSAPSAQASSYSGYDSSSFWLDGIKLQEWEVWVRIEKLPTDLNDDGIVDIFDVIVVATAFGTKAGDPKWDARADINNDGVVDIFDFTMVSADFGLCHHWNIKWKTTGSWPYTPLMFCWYLSYVKAWDDKGFSWKLPQIGLNGEVTIDHSNLYTWTYTQVTLVYAKTSFVYEYRTLKVGIYVET